MSLKFNCKLSILFLFSIHISFSSRFVFLASKSTFSGPSIFSTSLQKNENLMLIKFGIFQSKCEHVT